MNSKNDEKNKIRQWAADILREVKSTFGIHSPSTVMRDEVGKNLALGVAQGLYENDKEVVKQFKLMLDKLKYKRNTDIISEDEYYRGLERLRDQYFAVGTQQWQKYTAEIYKHQKDVLEQERKALEEECRDIQSLYDDVSKYATQRFDEVMEKQARYSDELKATGGLFDINSATINGVKYSYYSMHDLDADIKNLERYSEFIEKIRARSAALGMDTNNTEGFLDEIKSLNLGDASALMQLLDKSDDSKFTHYLSNWGHKNDIAESISVREYKKEFDETVDDVYSAMTEKLKTAGYEIPDGFYVSGSISAQKFGDAFIEELDKQLEEIRARVAEFNSRLTADINIGGTGGGVVYNNQTAYNISAADGADAVEQIRRYETVKRLSGVG